MFAEFVANSNNSDPRGPTIREERKQSIEESASIASLFPPNYSDTDDSSESNETLPRFSHYSNSIMELFSPARSGVSSGSSGASYFSTGNGPTTFSGPLGGMGGGGGGGGMRGSRFSSGIFCDDECMYQGAPRKAPPLETWLPCSCEELYKGATKKKKISREIADIGG